MAAAILTLLCCSFTQATVSDSTCVETEVPFDDCGDTLGEEIVARKLVLTNGDYVGLVGDPPRTLTTQAGLAAFWSESGLEAAGEPIPAIDFATEQGLAFQDGYGDDCGDSALVRNVFRHATLPATLVARVDIYDGCDGACVDTAVEPVLEVWAIPTGDVTVCRAGTRCETCP